MVFAVITRFPAILLALLKADNVRCTGFFVVPSPKVNVFPDVTFKDVVPLVLLIVNVVAAPLAAKLTLAETDNEFKLRLGTRVIVAAIGIITLSPATGAVPPDQLAAVFHLEFPLLLVHVLVA